MIEFVPGDQRRALFPALDGFAVHDVGLDDVKVQHDAAVGVRRAFLGEDAAVRHDAVEADAAGKVGAQHAAQVCFQRGAVDVCAMVRRRLLADGVEALLRTVAAFLW